MILFMLMSAVCMVSCGSASNKTIDLEAEIADYVSSCDAEIGVAVITDRGDTITVNNDSAYPMNSVMKLYQAMAAADVMQKRNIPLDSVLSVARGELHPAMYSPMRDSAPADSDGITISIASLIGYSLKQSDNNACDLLFDRIIGIGETEAYVRSLGIRNFGIKVNERAMYDDHEVVNRNWNHPLAAAELINRLFTETLFAEPYQGFLKRTLTTCRTGENRLSKPFIATNAVIGHKTGTGFDSTEGLPQGINDVGYVRLPNGRTYSVAVFVRTSKRGMAETEKMIADISAMVARSMCSD